MSSRHRAREAALQILYRYDAPGTALPEDARLAGELGQHFEHFRVPPALRDFSTLLVTGTLRQKPELDSTLERLSENWKLSRMSAIDRSLLRLAAFEMLHVTDTPSTVVIDEAVELAKQFGTGDSPAFVNGLLDALNKQRPK